MYVVNAPYLCVGWFGINITSVPYLVAGVRVCQRSTFFISMTACYYGRKDKQNMVLAIDILKQIDC